MLMMTIKRNKNKAWGIQNGEQKGGGKIEHGKTGEKGVFLVL